MNKREKVKTTIADSYGLNRSTVENILDIIEYAYNMKFDGDRVLMFNGDNR